MYILKENLAAALATAIRAEKEACLRNGPDWESGFLVMMRKTLQAIERGEQITVK